jgi:hypothetical protein
LSAQVVAGLTPPTVASSTAFEPLEGSTLQPEMEIHRFPDFFFFSGTTDRFSHQSRLAFRLRKMAKISS